MKTTLMKQSSALFTVFDNKTRKTIVIQWVSFYGCDQLFGNFIIIYKIISKIHAITKRFFGCFKKMLLMIKKVFLFQLKN
jgi:hypothetical protein